MKIQKVFHKKTEDCRALLAMTGFFDPYGRFSNHPYKASARVEAHPDTDIRCFIWKAYIHSRAVQYCKKEKSLV